MLRLPTTCIVHGGVTYKFYHFPNLSYLIIRIPPPFGWDNAFINNSAKITVLSLTVLLTIFFFIWLDKVVLYNGKSKALLKSIISKHSADKSRDESRDYPLKAINEITLYSISKQDEHLQKTLLEFYHRLFSDIRSTYDKSEPVIYPVDLYFLVNRITAEVVQNQNKKLRAIEHRAVSGVWLLGEFSEAKVSEETYRWLWGNLNIICENERLVKMFWANSSQYFEYRLQRINPEFEFKDGKARTLNETEIKQRNEERKEFLELHYALGGLILYRNQFRTLKYCFEFTQSQPPRYSLLPSSMTTIFEWFEQFRNEFKSRATPIEYKYYFPELDNLGSSSQVTYWICRYLTVLYIRQYSLNTYYIYDNFTALPNLPQDVIELNNWQDSVSYFEKCLNDTLNDKALIDSLRFTSVVETNRDTFNAFFGDLKNQIKEKIKKSKFSAELSPEKIKSFYENTNEIISNAFNDYNNIFNPVSIKDESEFELKLPVNGSTTLMSKSAFTDNDIPTLNYDTFFASHVASDKIRRYIPNSFYVARTKRYLFNQDNLIQALERIVDQNKDIVIVAIDVDYEINELLSNSKFSSYVINIPSTDSLTRGALFVLRKRDLPVIEHKELSSDKIERRQLKLLNNNLNVYASIIDINLPENKEIKDEWKFESEKDNLDLKVQLSISFISIIHWRNDREIIEIEVATRYREQGIQTDFNEIEPLRKNDNK